MKLISEALLAAAGLTISVGLIALVVSNLRNEEAIEQLRADITELRQNHEQPVEAPPVFRRTSGRGVVR